MTAVVPPNPERKKWVGIVENQKHVFFVKKIPSDHLQHQRKNQNQLQKKNQSLNRNQNQSRKSHKRVLRKSKSLLSISNTILTCWFEGHQQRPLWWQRWRHWKMARRIWVASMVTWTLSGGPALCTKGSPQLSQGPFSFPGRFSSTALSPIGSRRRWQMTTTSGWVFFLQIPALFL